MTLTRNPDLTVRRNQIAAELADLVNAMAEKADYTETLKAELQLYELIEDYARELVEIARKA